MSLKDTVRERMQELGINPKRSLGQNFLVSERVTEQIINAVLSRKPEQIIEVGPGLGALTDGLIESKIPLTLMELDSAFCKYWRGRDQEIIEGDALQIPWPQKPGKILLVSNLPYQISSRLVIDRCVEPHGIEWMVLMFQKEVAQRITAKPSTEDYSLLTVMAQTYWNVKLLLEAAPREFFPAPKIASRVLVFERKPGVQPDPESFLRLVKTGFAQKRKLLRKNLLAGYSEAQLGDYFGTALKETARAEELSPSDFLKLYEHVTRS